MALITDWQLLMQWICWIEMICRFRPACPVAANTVLFSVQYKRDSALASKTVAVSTVLSIISIPLMTILAQGLCNILY